MEDQEFEQLRDALAPENEKTARMGALYLIEVAGDDDDRLVSLLSTLLGDRDLELAASAAALIYKDERLKDLLEKELERAWHAKAPHYKLFLLDAIADAPLHELAPRFAEVEDGALRMRLLDRLAAIPESQRTMETLLFLSHDSNSTIRAASATVLAAVGGSVARTAVLRLSHDEVPNVRAAAALRLPAVCDEEEARRELARLADETDIDVRQAARNTLRRMKREAALDSLAPLVQQMAELTDSGEFRKAMAVGAKIFAKDPEHLECQYQMARAVAAEGDAARGARILKAAMEAGFEDWQRIEHDPALAELRESGLWARLKLEFDLA